MVTDRQTDILRHLRKVCASYRAVKSVVLVDRTNGRAYATVCDVSVTLCIVAN